MDWKIELVAVSDTDRAKSFYVDQVGFNADHDIRVSDELRFVQLTPPGTRGRCSSSRRVTETVSAPHRVIGHGWKAVQVNGTLY